MITIRNLAWLRGIKDFPRDFSSRMSEILTDVQKGFNTVEQQTGADFGGNPQAPPAIQAVHAQPHEHGVEVSIQHSADFYRGIGYYVDWAENSNMQGARTTYFGESRNGVIPTGNRQVWLQVRAKYPWSDSTMPVAHPTPVTGGIASSTLLPTQGSGTAFAHQPPHLQPPYRGTVPPTRTK